jgi:hypothetical protein
MSRRGDRDVKEKQVRFPGPDRPIAIEHNPTGVVLINATQEEEVL